MQGNNTNFIFNRIDCNGRAAINKDEQPLEKFLRLPQ